MTIINFISNDCFLYFKMIIIIEPINKILPVILINTIFNLYFLVHLIIKNYFVNFIMPIMITIIIELARQTFFVLKQAYLKDAIFIVISIIVKFTNFPPYQIIYVIILIIVKYLFKYFKMR